MNLYTIYDNCRDIGSYDENDLKHGYYETYNGPDSDSIIWLRVNYVHDFETGYEEYFGNQETTFYIR